MPELHWSSILFDEKGNVDFKRLRSLTSILLALGAACVVMGVILAIVSGRVKDIPPAALNLLETVTWAMIVPLTVGRGVDALNGWKKARTGNTGETAVPTAE